MVFGPQFFPHISEVAGRLAAFATFAIGFVADGAHVRIMPYWDWDYPREEERAGDGEEREWVERLRHTFEEAVRLRLRADVPVACYLSGGLDSCAVLGVAAQLAPQPLRVRALVRQRRLRRGPFR